MPQSPHPDQLTFKIHPAGGGSEVPVSLLIQSLSTLQEMILLFAWQEEGRTFRRRLRISDSFKDKYVLACRPPEKGSFAVSGRVMNRTGDADDGGKIADVMNRFHAFNHAAVAMDSGRLLELVPDSGIRSRALSCLISLSPPAGSGHRFELFNGDDRALNLDEELPCRLERLLKTDEERAEIQTVTGRLEAISFSDRRLTVNYAPKGRWLECSYDESVEPMLLENRRDLIQVTGRVIMDDENHPKKIVEVEQVRDLDLSPFIIGVISGESFSLKPRRSLHLEPVLSDNEQLICIERTEWSLDVFATTRSELFEELKEQLLMLWIEYAREEDGELSSPALAVKQKLNADWEEVTHAQG